MPLLVRGARDFKTRRSLVDVHREAAAVEPRLISAPEVIGGADELGGSLCDQRPAVRGRGCRRRRLGGFARDTAARHEKHCPDHGEYVAQDLTSIHCRRDAYGRA